MHIQKTAGRSIIKIFKDILGAENVNLLDGPIRLNTIKAGKLQNDTLICGHLCYRDVLYFIPERYSIVFLREPVDRLLSQYYFWRNDIEVAQDEYTIKAKELNLNDFLDYYSNNEILNIQTYLLAQDNSGRTLSGEELIARAKENLKTFNFIGIYEYFRDAIDFLCYDCKWPPVQVPPHINATTSRLKVADLERDTLKRIKELTVYDREIYQFAVTLFQDQKHKIMAECIQKNIAPFMHDGPFLPMVTTADDAQSTTAMFPDNMQNNKVTEPVEFGTREVIILDVYVTGIISGTTVIKTGEEADIKIYFQSSIDINNLTIGFSIEDIYGQNIFGTNSYHLKEKVSVEKDKLYCACYRFRMNIGEGLYKLNVALHNDDATSHKTCYHWKQHVSEFCIADHGMAFFEGIVKLYPTLKIREVEPMLPLPYEAMEQIEIRVIEIKKKLSLSQNVFAKVELRNKSSHFICSDPPYPIHFSYHWIEPETGEIAVYDGIRSKIVPPLLPGTSGEYQFVIDSPGTKGDFLLRLSLVQENVGWFDMVNAELKEDILIQVM